MKSFNGNSNMPKAGSPAYGRGVISSGSKSNSSTGLEILFLLWCLSLFPYIGLVDFFLRRASHLLLVYMDAVNGQTIQNIVREDQTGNTPSVSLWLWYRVANATTSTFPLHYSLGFSYSSDKEPTYPTTRFKDDCAREVITMTPWH